MLGATGALGGCFPVHQTQYLPESPEASYLRDDSCENSANVAQIAFHGIRIEVAIWSKTRRGVHVTYLVPAGVTAQLATDRAVLATQGDAGEHRVELSMSRLQGKRAAASTDPMTGADILHRYLFGLRASVSSARYEFRAEPWGMDYGAAGTLLLPDMTIDGASYPGPVINYHKSRTFGLVPLGC
jgi:hypothetical protein